MQYLTKMKIGSYISGIASLIFAVCSVIIFFLHITEATSAITGAWFFSLFAVISAAAGAAFMEKSTKKFIEKSEESRALVKYCYSCGYLLEKAEATETCPKCGAKLNLLKIIDE